MPNNVPLWLRCPASVGTGIFAIVSYSHPKGGFDGETTTDPLNLISSFPSGNNEEGGDFHFVFTTDFMGDYDNDGLVGQGDLDLVLLNWGGPDASVDIWAIANWINLPTEDPGGVIGQAEMDEVLLNWGESHYAELILLGDLNEDGIVDMTDVNLAVGTEEMMDVCAMLGVWFATNINPNPLGV